MSLAESFIEQEMKNLFGTSSNTTSNNSNNTDLGVNPAYVLPPGIISLDQLPPSEAEAIINQYQSTIPKGSFNTLIKRQNDRADAKAKADQVMDQMSAALYEIGTSDSSLSNKQKRNIVDKSFGETQATFVGDTGDDANWIQSAIAIAPSWLSGDFRRGRAAKKQLRGIFGMEAYQSLKGAGAISNFELQQAGPATTALFSKGISQERAYKLLNDLKKVNDIAQYRKSMNIEVDPVTNNEYIFDPRTRKAQRVYTAFNPETGALEHKPLNTDADVVNIPFIFDEAQFKSIYDNKPDGTIFIREGRAFIKGQ